MEEELNLKGGRGRRQAKKVGRAFSEKLCPAVTQMEAALGVRR